MKLTTLFLAGTLTLVSGVAFAHRCPAEMRAIDAALGKTQLSGEKLAEVKKLRAEGETLHKAGKHAESADTLDKAKKLLGI